MAFIEAKDGTEIYYNDWGKGPVVVLIHGWPLSSASWEFQAKTLAENGFRVITYDRRGFGRSGWSFESYDYDTLASDLATLLDKLNVTNAALVGFSMGGGEVARYVAKYGTGRVSKAVFISSVTPYLLKTPDNPEGVDPKVFDEMTEAIAKDRADFMKLFSAKFYGRTMIDHTVTDGQLEFWQHQAMLASPKATLDCVEAFAKTDFRDDLANFSIPTLVIHGNKDVTVPIAASGPRTAKLVPGAQLLEYDGEAHGLNVSAAEKLNQDLIAFLRA